MNPNTGQPSRMTAGLPCNPPVMVGGQAPLGERESPLSPVWDMLCMALRSEHVRFIHQRDGDKVWFVGAREQDFEGVGEFTSRLACGLPGHPLHKGDGAYLDQSGATPAMVLCMNGTLVVRTGTREQLERIARAEGATLFEAPADASGVWETLEALERAHAWKQFSRWMGGGVLTLGLALLVQAAGVVQLDQASSAALMREAEARQIHSALLAGMTSAAQNPLGTQLAALQKTQALVLRYRTDATPDVFIRHWKQERSDTYFEIVLPGHLRAEDYAPLGKDLTISRTAEGLVVSKPLPEKGATRP